MSDTKDDIFKIFEEAKSERSIRDTESQEITLHIAPQSKGFTNFAAKGDVDRTKIFDSQPERSADDLISSMAGYLASPDKKWFKLGLEGQEKPSYEAKTKLDTAGNKVRKHLAQARTNFYPTIASMAQQAVHHGQAFVYVHKMIKGRKKFVKFCTLPVQECYLQRDSYNDILYFFRYYELKKTVLLHEFDLDKSELDDHEKRKIREPGNENTPNKILHTIVDKKLAERLGVEAKKAYVSVYYHYNYKKILHVDHLDYFPIVAPYWDLLPDENYGRGPGHKALAEIRVLNQMIRDNLAAVNVMLSPPMAAMIDYLAAPERGIDLSPNALVYLTLSSASAATGLIKPEPINTVQDVPISVEMENQKRNQIRSTFLEDLLSDDKRVEMSATETQLRQMSKVLKLTRPITNLTTTGLAPLVMLTIEILDSWDIIDVDFEDEELEPVIMTALHDAINLSKVQILERVFASLTNTAAIPPQIINNFDMRELLEYFMEKYGADLDLLKSEEEAQAAQEQEERQQGIENLGSVASATKDLSTAFATAGEV